MHCRRRGRSKVRIEKCLDVASKESAFPLPLSLSLSLSLSLKGFLKGKRGSRMTTTYCTMVELLLPSSPSWLSSIAVLEQCETRYPQTLAGRREAEPMSCLVPTITWISSLPKARPLHETKKNESTKLKSSYRSFLFPFSRIASPRKEKINLGPNDNCRRCSRRCG